MQVFRILFVSANILYRLYNFSVLFERITYISIKKDNEVIVEMQTVGLDINFFFKTAILVRILGFSSKFFKRVSGKTDIIRAVKDNLFCFSDIDCLLNKYLEYIF